MPIGSVGQWGNQDFTMDSHNPWPDFDRDVRFFPCHCSNPSRLSQEQIAFFNQNGYLKGFRIFNDEEVIANRKYSESLVANLFWPMHIVTHPVILEYLQDLLGPNIVCWGIVYFRKMPGSSKRTTWHQDAHYWPLSPSKTVVVWLALEDADRENGCLQFLPGSHLAGELEYREGDPIEVEVLTPVDQVLRIYDDLVDVELRAGEISLHSDMLVHGAGRNNSDRPRCGLSMRYAPADVFAFNGYRCTRTRSKRSLEC